MFWKTQYRWCLTTLLTKHNLKFHFQVLKEFIIFYVFPQIHLISLHTYSDFCDCSQSDQLLNDCTPILLAEWIPYYLNLKLLFFSAEYLAIKLQNIIHDSITEISFNRNRIQRSTPPKKQCDPPLRSTVRWYLFHLSWYIRMGSSGTSTSRKAALDTEDGWGRGNETKRN